MAINKLSDLWKILKEYTGRRDNPQQTTAQQVSAYTKAELDALVKTVLPDGVLPLARWGKYDGSPNQPTLAQGILTFAENTGAYLYDLMILGKAYHLPAATYNLNQLITGGVTKLYFYAGVYDGVAAYKYSPTPLPISPLQIFLGTCTTTLNYVSKSVWVVDGYYLEYNPIGNGIPTSFGDPLGLGQYNW